MIHCLLGAYAISATAYADDERRPATRMRYLHFPALPSMKEYDAFCKVLAGAMNRPRVPQLSEKFNLLISTARHLDGFRH
jgi:hypothetical protein